MRHLNNLKYMAMALFVAMLSLSFTACSDDDDDSETSVTGTSITGTWVDGTPEDGEVTTLVFGTGRGTLTYIYYDSRENETSRDVQNFEYAYDAEDKILSIIGDDCDYQGQWRVSLTATRLLLSPVDADYYGSLSFVKQ